ncbi:MAG: hypothetical protein ACRD5K_11665 [Candidatus Acidiferrales bacterium]
MTARAAEHEAIGFAEVSNSLPVAVPWNRWCLLQEGPQKSLPSSALQLGFHFGRNPRERFHQGVTDAAEEARFLVDPLGVNIEILIRAGRAKREIHKILFANNAV